MDPLTAVGLTALTVLVVSWLWVSFRPPGPRRAVVEWVGTTALYAALLCLFLSLVRRALEGESTAALFGFGFLATFFSLGLLVSLAKTIGQLRGRKDAGPSTTG